MAKISIDAVVFDIRNYPRRDKDGRISLNKGLIETYACAWLAGDKFPAIQVVKTKDGVLYLQDGAHRWMARFLVRDKFMAGEINIPGLTEDRISTIEVIIVDEKPDQDQEIEAGAANCTHGERLAPRDLNRLIQKSFRLSPGVTAVEIARKFKIHRKTAEKKLRAAVKAFRQQKYNLVKALRDAGSSWEGVALEFKHRWPEAKGGDPSALRRFFEDVQRPGKKVHVTLLPDQNNGSSKAVNPLGPGSLQESTAYDAEAGRYFEELTHPSARESARQNEEENSPDAQAVSPAPVYDIAPRLFIIQKNEQRWCIQWDHLTHRERQELDRVLCNALASYEHRHAPNGDPNKMAWDQVACPVDESDEQAAQNREAERGRVRSLLKLVPTTISLPKKRSKR